MALIDKETIRAEIERLKERAAAERVLHPQTILAAKNYLLIKDYDNLLSFLDTLPEQPVTDHHEIEVEFRGEKVTVNREFYRKEDKNYSTNEQDDNVIWSALRAWCEKKGITPFELYPKQPEQPVGKTCKTCGFYENNCPYIRGKLIPYPNKVCKDYTYSVMKAQAQLAEGLNEEIENYYGYIPDDKDKIESARHFAEWQKGNIKNLLKSWAENELDEYPNKNDDFRLAIYSLIDKLNDL